MVVCLLATNTPLLEAHVNLTVAQWWDSSVYQLESTQDSDSDWGHLYSCSDPVTRLCHAHTFHCKEIQPTVGQSLYAQPKGPLGPGRKMGA